MKRNSTFGPDHHPLMADCGIGYKPLPLYVSRKDMGQTKNLKYMSNHFFPYSGFCHFWYHDDECSIVHFSYQFGFNWLYKIELEHHDVGSAPPLQMTSPVKDGSACIHSILTSFLQWTSQELVHTERHTGSSETWCHSHSYHYFRDTWWIVYNI